MQISHGRADVFAIAYDKRIYEYEVKVAKSDFDSELKSIKHIMDGIKNTEP